MEQSWGQGQGSPGGCVHPWQPPGTMGPGLGQNPGGQDCWGAALGQPGVPKLGEFSLMSQSPGGAVLETLEHSAPCPSGFSPAAPCPGGFRPRALGVKSWSPWGVQPQGVQLCIPGTHPYSPVSHTDPEGPALCPAGAVLESRGDQPHVPEPRGSRPLSRGSQPRSPGVPQPLSWGNSVPSPAAPCPEGISPAAPEVQQPLYRGIQPPVLQTSVPGDSARCLGVP